MENDNKAGVFVKSLGEALSKATNVPVFYQDHSELIESIVDLIRNKLPAKTKQKFNDISDNELGEQLSEFLTHYQVFAKEKSEEHF
jgi:hypothetical protein